MREKDRRSVEAIRKSKASGLLRKVPTQVGAELECGKTGESVSGRGKNRNDSVRVGKDEPCLASCWSSRVPEGPPGSRDKLGPEKEESVAGTEQGVIT